MCQAKKQMGSYPKSVPALEAPLDPRSCEPAWALRATARMRARGEPKRRRRCPVSFLRRVLGCSAGVEVLARDPYPHQFPEALNRKHPGGFRFPDAVRRPAFRELSPRPPSCNSLPRKCLSSITLLGPELKNVMWARKPEN